MKNQVIEVLDRDHGKRVVDYWESKGINTCDFLGIRTKKDGDIYRYYGVIDGYFNVYSEEQVVANNAEIIQLPTESPKEEKTFPRVMLVSDDEYKWYKRVVFMKKCDRYFAWDNVETIEESESICVPVDWRYAKEILEKVKLTKAEIAEMFGIEPEQLEMVD